MPTTKTPVTEKQTSTQSTNHRTGKTKQEILDWLGKCHKGIIDGYHECDVDPSTLTSAEFENLEIIATFTPQAWIDDYSVDVDPEGDTEWQITLNDLVHTDLEFFEILAQHENAPEWVRDWCGPYLISLNVSKGSQVTHDEFGTKLNHLIEVIEFEIDTVVTDIEQKRPNNIQIPNPITYETIE